MRQSKFKNLFNIFSGKKNKRTKPKDFFKKTKKDKLYKATKQNKKLEKKRKALKIKFDFQKKFTFLRSVYIPYLFITFLLILIIGIGVLLSPIFQVKNIDIIKKDNITDMIIAYKAVENIRGNSIFNVDKKDLLKKFKNYQENIKDIDLKLKLANTIYIEIESFKELFNVYVGGKNYLLLENGSFVPVQEKNKTLETLNVVNNFGENLYLDYSIVYEEKYVEKITEIIRKLNENILGIKITALNYFYIEREFHVEINDFTTLIFSVDDSISVDEQIRNLAIFNKDSQNINNKNIIYIDLRIKSKAFICEKEEEYQCNQNFNFLYPELDIKTNSGSKEKENSIG